MPVSSLLGSHQPLGENSLRSGYSKKGCKVYEARIVLPSRTGHNQPCTMMTQIMMMSATVIMFKYIVEEDKMWTQDYYKA